MELYERIKKRRLELGLTQEELAKRIGYKSRSTIAKIESGENDIVRSQIIKFANALETSPADLMGWVTYKGTTKADQTVKEVSSGYYVNKDTAKIAQQIYDNPDMRILFDAAKNASPEDLKFVAEMMLRMRRKEQGDID